MRQYFVTGGSRGIGAATVSAIIRSDADAQVKVASRSQPLSHPNVSWIRCDLATRGGVQEATAALASSDVLINNAGLMIGKGALDISSAEQELTVALNQTAVVELSLAIIRGAAARPIRIVNNVSIAAHLGHPDIWYGMTKASILNLTKSLAKNFGAQGVICNCVAAGPVETDMLAKIPEARQQMMKANAITGRFARPEEVAAVMVWLATEAPEYVNGVCIDVNNGTFLR